MKGVVTAAVVIGALVVSAADVSALGSNHSRRGGGSESASVGSAGIQTASVPEPSTLYALGSGLALLGGAGWFIRRRK